MNAIDYNKRGGDVRLTTRSAARSAVFTAIDPGIGVPAADVQRIFDRFYRADKARSRASGRTGLGLAICKTIVEAEGGTIDIESELQVGTTFTVRLPIYGP